MLHEATKNLVSLKTTTGICVFCHILKSYITKLCQKLWDHFLYLPVMYNEMYHQLFLITCHLLLSRSQFLGVTVTVGHEILN